MTRVNKTKATLREHIATSILQSVKRAVKTIRAEINNFVHLLIFCPKPVFIVHKLNFSINNHQICI